MWLDFVQGKEGLERIFGNKPYGSIVELRRISFEDCTTIIEFDLQEWPENPPAKWLAQKFNTIQVKLAIGGCAEINFKDWAQANIGVFRIKELNSGVLLSFKFVSNSGAYFSCVCDALLISSISSYTNV